MYLTNLHSCGQSGKCECSFCFFYNASTTTEISTSRHTHSLHDALPISGVRRRHAVRRARQARRSREAVAQRRLSASRSEEHTSELQSLMRISYAVFCLKKKTKKH